MVPTQLPRGHPPPLPHYHAAGISLLSFVDFYSYSHSLQLSRTGTSILFAQCSLELLVATQF